MKMAGESTTAQGEQASASPSDGERRAPVTSLGFRRFAWSTLGAVFLLVVLGGIVRVSDSGLGCGPGGSGLKGWPLCNGRLIPGLDVNHVLEYSHRTVASTVGFMTIILFVWAWRRHRDQTAIVKLAGGAVALVVFEGVLGGATVEYDLHETLVAIHLGIAMFILGLTLQAARFASGYGGQSELWSAGVKRLTVITGGAVWCTIVAGAYMSGTQGYGREGYEMVGGARLACGREFPTCRGGFLPFGDDRLINIHLIHRSFMYVTVILVLTLAALVIKRASGRSLALRPVAIASVGIVALQVLLGALNVWLTKTEWLILAHLTVATLLWLAVLWLTLNITGRRAPVAGTAPAPAGR